MKLCLSFVLLLFNLKIWANDCLSSKPIKTFYPSESKSFFIDYFEGYKVLHRGSDRVLLKNKNLKLNCETSLFVIETPVEKIVLTSSTHLPALLLLNIEDKLVGFQGKKYIYSNRFNREKIFNISFPLVAEELLKIKPDLVMSYETNNSSQETIEKMRKLKLPLVLNDDYKETNALARAEWVIYIASFFNKEENAIKTFHTIVEKYNMIKNIIAKEKLRKKILVGTIQNGKWVMCGGKSDLARLIDDAGGDLFFSSNTAITQSRSLEDLYIAPVVADVWMTQNNWKDLSPIKLDSRYKKIQAKKIYNIHSKINASGANDYWEMGMARPDLMLEDLASIFHPEYFSNHKLIWYKSL